VFSAKTENAVKQARRKVPRDTFRVKNIPKTGTMEAL
jgi:hypothetical protein